jgi:hypothetical protein
MSHSFRRNLTSSTSVNSAGLAALAAVVLAASAFLTTAPATAATSSEPAAYCLSGDNGTDCGFSSRAQCEATASGGLGVCNVMPSWQEPRDRYAVGHLASRLRG